VSTPSRTKNRRACKLSGSATKNPVKRAGRSLGMQKQRQGCHTRRLLVRSGLFGLTVLKEDGYSSGIAVLADFAVPEIIGLTPNAPNRTGW
jgi:hypothetical protein